MRLAAEAAAAELMREECDGAERTDVKSSHALPTAASIFFYLA